MELSNGLMLKNNQIVINPDGPIGDEDNEFQDEDDGIGKPVQTKESQDRKPKKKKISKTV